MLSVQLQLPFLDLSQQVVYSAGKCVIPHANFFVLAPRTGRAIQCTSKVRCCNFGEVTSFFVCQKRGSLSLAARKTCSRKKQGRIK